MSATMTLVTAPPVDTRPRRAPKKALPWGSPVVYFVALASAGVHLTPPWRFRLRLGSVLTMVAVYVESLLTVDAPDELDHLLGVAVRREHLHLMVDTELFEHLCRVAERCPVRLGSHDHAYPCTHAVLPHLRRLVPENGGCADSGGCAGKCIHSRK